MCDTISHLPYTNSHGSKSDYIIPIERSITEPDNGHKTESISPKLTDYKQETERLKTFENWKSQIVKPEDLAKAGFYYLDDPRQSDLVKCAFCNAEICNWEPGDNALQEHIKWSPNCPHAKELCKNDSAFWRSLRGEDVCGNGELFLNSVPESETFRRLSELGKSYDDESLRLETFATWPKTVKQQPKALAEAGFYYRGVEDHTICFSCGGALKDWIAEDNPWEQHAMWFPTCSFLLAKKGQDYIDEVQKKIKPPVPNATKEEKEERSFTPQEVLLCKICDSNERNVIFIPCKHILACAECSELLDKCPVCRQPIEDRMKVFLS